MSIISKLGHVVMHARDVPGLTGFYRDLFDMRVDGEDYMTFLGFNDPDVNHHDIGFVSNEGGAHVAFHVDTLDDLREFYEVLKSRGIPVIYSQVVVAGVIIQFRDPEGNRVEICWPHRRWGKFPFMEKFDLDTMTNEDIMRIVDSMPVHESADTRHVG